MMSGAANRMNFARNRPTSRRQVWCFVIHVLSAALVIHQAAAFHAPAFHSPRLSMAVSSMLHGPRQPVLSPVASCRVTTQQSSMLLGFSALANPTVIALATLPAVAKTVIANVNAQLLDCIFAGLLYVLGKITSSAFLGKQESLSSLTKWFTCGLFDGWALHWWYTTLDYNFSFMPALQQTAIMNGLSSVFYTPTYCASFLILLSLLEFKGLRGAMNRVSRDWKDLASKSVLMWSILNVPLFLCVPVHLRVVVSMGIHYLYLVGLGLWDANARQQHCAKVT
mmetsp:Transcript_78563/g.127460  ORF Transcript_78563/g.127460 Transcript_78563/m.127460 type:complete len:281 (+) Transcript_78563:139-981(+)